MGNPTDPLAIVDRVAQKSEQANLRSAEAEREEATGFAALDEQDALDLLLSAEPAEQVQTVELPARKGTKKPLKLVLRSITEQEWEDIKNQSEITGNRSQRRSRKRGEDVELDNSLMARLLVKRATVNVDWNHRSLREKFKVEAGEDVVRKLLLYGEVANLAQIVMEISGFDEDKIRFIEDLSDGAEKPAS